MRAQTIEHIGRELAIRWDDETEDFLALETLRRACPCAGCSGEVDILGNLYKNPEKPLQSKAFELIRFVPVGGYAIQLYWADGHNSGLYTFEYLKKIAAVRR